jgi:hypothetical protein
MKITNHVIYLMAILLAIFGTRYCTTKSIKCEKVSNPVQTIAIVDTIFAKPDTITNTVVRVVTKTEFKTKEIPTFVTKTDTNTYEYVLTSYHDNAVGVIDTISVKDNQIVEHKQRVVVDETKYVTTVEIEKPILITKDSIITITNTVTKSPFFVPSVGINTVFSTNSKYLQILPSISLQFGKHEFTGGRSITNPYYLVGYKYRLRK